MPAADLLQFPPQGFAGILGKASDGFQQGFGFGGFLNFRGVGPRFVFGGITGRHDGQHAFKGLAFVRYGAWFHGLAWARRTRHGLLRLSRASQK